MTGRVALVTGGASGIGAAVVERLAGANARVVVVDVDAEGATRVAKGVGGVAFAADLTDPEASRRAVTLTLESFGRLDYVHLNAGVTGAVDDLAELDVAGYRGVTGVNMDAVVFGVRAALPALRAAGGGAIVVTASLAGLVGFPPDPIYTMTKHAVVGLVRALADPLAAQGIRVSAVCPGFVDTPMVAEIKPAFVEAGFPLLEPGEVATTVVGLLTDGPPGGLWVVQPGREPIPYVFAGVPGPGGDGAHRRPPQVH